MRPRVIPTKGDSGIDTALNGKKKSIVAGRPAAIDSVHKTKVLPCRRIIENEAPALQHHGLHPLEKAGVISRE